MVSYRPLGREKALSIGPRVFVLLFVMLLVSSCGYRFQGSTSILPDDIKTVFIPIVENNTPEPGLGIRFTEVLRSRFDRYGVITVVEDQSIADSVLRVRVVGLDTRVRDVTGATDIELELELIISVAGELRRSSGQVLWRNPLIQAAEAFATTSDVVVTSSAQFATGGIGQDALGSLGAREVSRGQSEEALSNVMEEVARRIYLDAVAADF